jgi:hypothetical protein
MSDNYQASAPRGRRTWLIPAAIAALLLIADVAGNLIANDLDRVLKPYRVWVWVVFGIALIAAVVGAVRDSRRSKLDPAAGTEARSAGERNITVGGDATGCTVITGDRDVVAIGSRARAVGGDEIHGVKVEGDQIIYVHEAPLPTFTALHQLKPAVADFTGREAPLAELRQKVKAGSVAIFGVRGMGGAGKTELARRLAAELKADCPDAQIELDLKGVSPQPLSASEVLSSILRAFHPTAKLPEEAKELAALLRSTLEGKRVLLLLDNTQDGQQIAPLLPPPAKSLVLVTSRQHFTLPGLEAVNLSQLDPGEACALLRKIEPRVGGEVEALAEACGRLPLALRLAGSLLANRPDLPPAEYVRQMNASRDRLRLLDQGQRYTAEDLGLEASFGLSWDQLTAEQQRLFGQLSVFLDRFDGAAAQAVWAREEAVATETLGVLMRLSQLEWRAESSRYELHELLREYAEKHLGVEDQQVACRRHAAHFTQVAEEAHRLYRQGGDSMLKGLALFDRERRQIEAAFGFLRSKEGLQRGLIALVNATSHTGGLRFPSQQRIDWLRAQGLAAQHIGDRRSEGAAVGNLGVAYRTLGQS